MLRIERCRHAHSPLIECCPLSFSDAPLPLCVPPLVCRRYVEREAPCKVHVCIPDTDKRSTNHYRERLYKEVEHFKKEESRAQQQGKVKGR
jgi:hypothetical protein